jgi:hypothetical protein
MAEYILRFIRHSMGRGVLRVRSDGPEPDIPAGSIPDGRSIFRLSFLGATIGLLRP